MWTSDAQRRLRPGSRGDVEPEHGLASLGGVRVDGTGGGDLAGVVHEQAEPTERLVDVREEPVDRVCVREVGAEGAGRRGAGVRQASTTSRAASSRARNETAMSHPARASAMAVAAPIPLLPPVTSATGRRPSTTAGLASTTYMIAFAHQRAPGA